MNKVMVMFTSTNGEEWTVELMPNEANMLLTHKPLLDGNDGSKVYKIDECRFDLDNGQWHFWISEA